MDLFAYEISPGAWQPPASSIPGWNWTPPGRALCARWDRMPLWVRIWSRVPWVDRYARAYMWRHGGWDIVPMSDAETDGQSGVREP